jgi:uncharacterized membrane protein YphA (DoxX/SURF4 family)
MFLNILKILCALSFLIYGLSCLFNKKMVQEFERFGLRNFRVLIGILQMAAAIGLLLGFRYPILTLLSSGGLALLMLLGVLVRLKLKDPLMITLPAFAFLLLNLYIFIDSLN